ncbi:MAG: Rap1a/Tai family immunity protein [Pseudomonadota bacterium]
MSIQVAPAVHAVPSSDELIAICERALSRGYRGKAAQMCTWYVTPCDCDVSTKQIPRVCIPKEIPSARLAEQVVILLKGLPEFQDSDGAVAAAEVLSVVYPCQASR